MKRETAFERWWLNYCKRRNMNPDWLIRPFAQDAFNAGRRSRKAKK